MVLSYFLRLSADIATIRSGTKRRSCVKWPRHIAGILSMSRVSSITRRLPVRFRNSHEPSRSSARNNNMGPIVYILGALTTLLCAFLLLRGFVQGREKLLLWSGLCFVG